MEIQESKDERMEASRGESNSNAGRLHVNNAIPRYSEREAETLAEGLVNTETFREAQQVLITWLEDGQCNERNAIHFYSLIQLCWNHMEKLQTEQKEYFKEAQKVQESLGNKSCYIQLHLNDIEELFKVIEKENIWGNFTQNQIEKIHEMRTDILDLKQNILNGSVGIVVEEEETNGMKNLNSEDVQTENVAYKVQTKAGSLTYGLNSVNQKSEDPKTRCKECPNEILKLKSELENSRKLREKNNSISVDDKQQKNSDAASQCNSDQLHQNEMYIVSMVSVLLFDNPNGVNIDCIYSHLNRNIPEMFPFRFHAREIEEVMRRYPKIFKESSPIGATQEKKWTCISINQKTLTELSNE